MSDDLSRFLAEDLGHGDITTESLLGDEQAIGRIRANSRCVVAGLEEAGLIIERMGATFERHVEDGEQVEHGKIVLTAKGPAKSILTSERLALNFVMIMSGIATATRDLVDRARAVNPNVRVAGTRKTTPGFRRYEKRAIVLGGGDPHRFRLDDQVLIKDNHLKMVGNVAEAVTRAKKFSFSKVVEIEVETADQAEEAVRAGADAVLLDNMTPEMASEAYARVKELNSNIIVEVSGGIRPDTIAAYAPFADVISVGYITHSAPAADFSMEIEVT